MCLNEVVLMNYGNKLYLQYENNSFVYKKEVLKVNKQFVFELNNEFISGKLNDIKEIWYNQINKGKDVVISAHRF